MRITSLQPAPTNPEFYEGFLESTRKRQYRVIVDPDDETIVTEMFCGTWQDRSGKTWSAWRRVTLHAGLLNLVLARVKQQRRAAARAAAPVPASIAA